MIYKKKSFWIVLSIVVLLVVSVLIARWYVVNRLEDEIKLVLEKKVSESTNGLYHLTIEKINANVFQGHLKIKGIALIPDQQRLSYLKEVDSLPAYYANANIHSIEFKGTGFKWRSAMHSLSFDKIEIDKPQIQLTKPQKTITPSSKESQTLYQLISDMFDKVEVRDILINKGNLQYHEEKETDTLVCEFQNINCHAENFLIDSLADQSRNLLYCNNIDLSVEKVNYTYNNNAFLLHIDSIDINTKDSTLTVQKVALIPQYGKYEFAYKVKEHPDWSQANAEDIQCFGFDFYTLLNDKSIQMDSMSLANGVYSSYKNQQIYVTPKHKPFPYEKLQKSSIHINIPSITVKNGSVSYEELAKEGKTPGKIYFNAVNGKVQNFTNNNQSEDKSVTFKLNGKLMGKGNANTTFVFPVDSTHNRFEFYGTLHNMDLTALSAFLGPLGNVEVASGYSPRLDFHMRSDAWNGNVDMLFLYNDLRLTILHEKNDEYVKWGFATGALDLLIKRNNPMQNTPKQATSHHQRDPHRSMFNHIWKTLLPGLMETVGIPQGKSQTTQKNKK